MKKQSNNKTTIQQNNANSPIDLKDAQRFSSDVQNGLTSLQVARRQEEGLVNVDTSKRGKSVAQIIFGNLFTFFNMLYFAIAVVLACYNQYDNCTFLIVAVANTLIAIFQELRSKKTLDKLNLITEPQAEVIRDGVTKQIPVSELVLDDVVILKSGAQISADCVVIDGFVEVNESVLTGESDAVTKNAGDTLFAGSFVVSNACTARVDKVGKYNYIAGLTGRAKQYQKPRSEMLRSLKIILIFVAIFVVPMAIGLWTTNYKFFVNEGAEDVFIQTLNKTSGSIISMIPAGPFLLTTVALAVSVIRLGKSKTMVQELYCIEMLARVDCLCLDKTGTITDGTMRVVENIDMRSGSPAYTVREIVGSMNSALKADNMTAKALKEFFGTPKKPALVPTAVVPFSSARKFSAVSFKGVGTFFLGAPEFVLKAPSDRVNDLVNKYAQEGLRVLVLAQSTSTILNNEKLPAVRRAIALIVIEDHLRPDAEETIGWFRKNGVDVKVISGDNPVTVSNIACRVGIENADKYVSLEGMTDTQVQEASQKYTVFGRVSPDQKALLVKCLKAQGKTVAMTGDGVNDILAMKESDCSISLAGGSDAARKVSHLVLLEDNFSALPKVVAEGRRVVNNIQSSTSLYFMKTLYIIVINIMLIVLDLCFGRTLPSPYETIQIFILETVIIGLSTTVLALQPNESKIEGHFLGNVLKRCLPYSITFIVGTVSLYVAQILFTNADGTQAITGKELSTLIALTYTFGGYCALFYACKPFNKWKIAMYAGLGVVSLLAVVLLPATFHYELFDCREKWLLLVVELLAVPYILIFNRKLFCGRQPDYIRKNTNDITT